MKKYKSFIILSTILILLFILSLFMGSWDISISEVLNIIFNNKDIEFNKYSAILKVRLPRILLAIISGAILGVCGVICQSCFNNPLVSPYFLGISSGAAFGSAFAIVFSLNPFIFSPLFTFIAVLIPLIFSLVYNSTSTLRLILLGIIINSIFSSLLSILKVIADVGKLREITFWLMGSLANGNMKEISVLYIIFFILFIYLIFLSSKIDLITLGSIHAHEQGIDTNKLKFILLLIVSILMSFSVMLTGIISWIGLGVPHLSRLIWKTTRLKELLINSAFGGAILLLACDLFTRAIIKLPLFNKGMIGELPISVTTSLFGALFLFIFLYKNIKYSE